MGNLYSKQSDGVVPIPSGRSVPRETADRGDIVIDNIPDKTADEIDPQTRIISMIKMQEYYTEEERTYFWGGQNSEIEQGDPNEDSQDDDAIHMASRADVNTLYENSRKTEDFFKENIRKLYPMAIKHSYKTELENIKEIIAVIEYYKSDIEAALGKLKQDVDSPLFVSILSHRNDIFDHIVREYPQYFNQNCCGLSVCASAIMFDNQYVFMSLFRHGKSVELKCVYTLFSMALDMFWSEEKLGHWFGEIKSKIKWSHLTHLRKIVHQEFQRLLVKYPQVMEELLELTKELRHDAEQHGQA